MIDPKHIGLELEPLTVTAEPGLMRLFAKATGQTDPVYFSHDAAIAAGYRGILGAPTYGLCLYSANRTDGMAMYRTMGARVERIVHGEQHFDYSGIICAGDTLSFTGKVVDIFSKRNGALDMVVHALRGVNQAGEEVLSARATTIIRN